jgi:hypothetical protein
MTVRASISSLLLCLIGAVVSLNAKVVRVEVTSRTDVLNGQAFGRAGAYERVVGRVYFSVSVANPHNRRIVDLDKAVNLKNGSVEFSSDFCCCPSEGREQGQRLPAARGSEPRPRAHYRHRRRRELGPRQ